MSPLVLALIKRTIACTFSSPSAAPRFSLSKFLFSGHYFQQAITPLHTAVYTEQCLHSLCHFQSLFLWHGRVVWLWAGMLLRIMSYWELMFLCGWVCSCPFARFCHGSWIATSLCQASKLSWLPRCSPVVCFGLILLCISQGRSHGLCIFWLFRRFWCFLLDALPTGILRALLAL